MKLIIDNREPKHIVTLIKNKIELCELDNLDIGDFKILDDNDNVICLIERKSLNDLLASVKDGRYTEQSFRLDEMPLDNKKIFYIIEGNILNYCNRKDDSLQKTIYSCILSLSYKKGFSVLNSNNEVETAEYIIKFFEKMSSKGFFDTKNQNYSNTIKNTKKSKITKENINQIMLMQIPGVSENISNSLLTQYNDIFNLITCLKNDPNCLDNFKVKYKNGERKISKNIINVLIELLC